MNLMWFTFNERNHNIFNTIRIYEVHIFKNKNKRKLGHFCLSFFLLYLFNCSCKFAAIETRTYDIPHDENVERKNNIEFQNKEKRRI